MLFVIDKIIMILNILSGLWIICIIAFIFYTRKRTKHIRDKQSDKTKRFITITVIMIILLESLIAYLSIQMLISKEIAILLFCISPISVAALSYLFYTLLFKKHHSG